MTTQKNDPKQHQNRDADEGGLTFEVVEEENQNGKKAVGRGMYLIPNLITTLSMLAAFFSLILSANGELYKAAMAIFVSAVLDGLDGRAARLLGAQSAFGEQYDSLADMLAFGLAPALLAYHFALRDLGRVGIACAFVFVACAAFRLARFNVQIARVDKKYFIGLASPLAALLVASSVMALIDHSNFVHQGGRIGYGGFALWVFVCAILMVSNLKYYSFKDVKKQKVPFMALIVAVLVGAMVLYDIPVGVLAIGALYALSGIWTTLRAQKC